MNWKLLNVAVVEVLHQKQIEMFGGSLGLRDAGLLESAVLRAEHKAYFDPDAGIGSLAASLGYGLIKNHAFIDGNKRAGLSSVVAFLKVNGYLLDVTTVEQISTVQRVAASEMSEDEWTAWVERSVRPDTEAAGEILFRKSDSCGVLL